MATERRIHLPEIVERERAVEIAPRNLTTDLNGSSVSAKQLNTGRYGTPLEKFSTTGSGKIDKGPLFDTMHFKVDGPASDVFDRVCNFMENLENCDYEPLKNDTIVQGCYFALPRYIQFRLGVRQSHVDPTHFIVEAQRRNGDAWLMSVVYNRLRRSFMYEEEESNELSPSSERELTESDSGVDFHTIDVSQSSEDVLHWVHFLNGGTLETIQSGSSVLALAAQSQKNLEFILAQTEGIVQGINTTFQLTEDKLTIYSCASLLACLAADANFSLFCTEQPIFKNILDTIFKWSGLKQEKLHLKSQQIINKLTITLLRIRESVGDEVFFQTCNIDENLESITTLQQNITGFSEADQQALGGVLGFDSF